jgi:hypothetical protein
VQCFLLVEQLNVNNSELIVIYGERLVSFFCMWKSNFPNTIY